MIISHHVQSQGQRDQQTGQAVCWALFEQLDGRHNWHTWLPAAQPSASVTWLPAAGTQLLTYRKDILEISDLHDFPPNTGTPVHLLLINLILPNPPGSGGLRCPS
jgi:hypothetical protein